MTASGLGLDDSAFSLSVTFFLSSAWSQLSFGLGLFLGLVQPRPRLFPRPRTAPSASDQLGLGSASLATTSSQWQGTSDDSFPLSTLHGPSELPKLHPIPISLSPSRYLLSSPTCLSLGRGVRLRGPRLLSFYPNRSPLPLASAPQPSLRLGPLCSDTPASSPTARIQPSFPHGSGQLPALRPGPLHGFRFPGSPRLLPAVRGRLHVTSSLFSSSWMCCSPWEMVFHGMETYDTN